MSKVICEKEDLVAIADAVRSKTGTTEGMTLSEISTNINNISGGGTGNGFIEIPFGNETAGEPLTLPDGLTFEDLASNPARFVLKPVAGSQVLTFQQVIMLNQSGSQLAYAYAGYMDYTPAGVGTGLVKVIITIQPDLTYSLSGGPVTDNGFVVLEGTLGDDGTGSINIPENFDMSSVEIMHNVLLKVGEFVLRFDSLNLDNTATFILKIGDGATIATVSMVDFSFTLSSSGSSGGTAQAIIDVESLPGYDESNKEAFYRVRRSGKIYAGNAAITNGKVVLCNTLPSIGLPAIDVTTSDLCFYYETSSKQAYGYVNSTLVAYLASQNLTLSVGWYPISELVTAWGSTYGGVINSESEITDDSAIYLMLTGTIYGYINGEWGALTTSSRKIIALTYDLETNKYETAENASTICNFLYRYRTKIKSAVVKTTAGVYPAILLPEENEFTATFMSCGSLTRNVYQGTGHIYSINVKPSADEVIEVAQYGFGETTKLSTDALNLIGSLSNNSFGAPVSIEVEFDGAAD